MSYCRARARVRVLRGLLYLAAIAVICIGSGEAGATQSLRWRVENPFRLFLDPDDTARHRKVFEGLSVGERARPILAAEQRLALEAPRGWAEAMVSRVCWSPTAQRYACDPFEDYVNPKSHRVIAELDATNAATAKCKWSLVYRQNVGRRRQVIRLQLVGSILPRARAGDRDPFLNHRKTAAGRASVMHGTG